ncbi:hypothetical protein G7Y89_g8885 [Cudoniella acicularis]|uniref:Uncharacterized protein n=1 Tax=Cudoniella acicularis TaxID=354080 RepID=A0A8H4W348_9HELO|nr:hypothetical protein G7Y89_g8885 [Cudoniella acicularis]
MADQPLHTPVSTNSKTAYMLTDISCLEELPEEARRHIMKQIIAIQNPKLLVCDFLDKFPREIRDFIYEHLLIKPVLAEHASIRKDGEYGAKAVYELAPNILRVCWQIYEEASPVLYKRNTFLMAFGFCRNIYGGYCIEMVSPLTRYQSFEN